MLGYRDRHRETRGFLVFPNRRTVYFYETGWTRYIPVSRVIFFRTFYVSYRWKIVNDTINQLTILSVRVLMHCRFHEEPYHS